MSRINKIIISLILISCILVSCGSTLKKTVTENTINNHRITFSIPENWVYDTDEDIFYFADSAEKLENEEWDMMLSANLISTVGDNATAKDIADKKIISDFNEKLIKVDELSKKCVFVKAEGNELSYFIVSDEKTGIYIYGRTYNATVDVEIAKEIAEKIKLS